jgi:cytochrome c2
MRLRRIGSLTALALALSTGLHPAFAEADVARGKKLYRTWCVGCHGDKETAASVGPSLVGLIGRRAGTVNGTPYARNLYRANITWDEQSLNRYLAAPSEEVHGTIMPVGVQDAGERIDLIAYLKTLK